MIANLVGTDIGKDLAFRFSDIHSGFNPINIKYLKYFISLENSGFVYGTIGFVEKIFVGIVILLVQNWMPNLSNDNATSVLFFKYILAFGLGGILIFSLILLVILVPKKQVTKIVFDLLSH